MSSGRVTRKKLKKAQKRQRPGSIAAYKRKLTNRRRKNKSTRINMH